MPSCSSSHFGGEEPTQELQPRCPGPRGAKCLREAYVPCWRCRKRVCTPLNSIPCAISHRSSWPEAEAEALSVPISFLHPRVTPGCPGAVGVHPSQCSPCSEAGRQPPRQPCSDKEAASRHRLGKQLKHKSRHWKNQKGKRAPQLYPPLIPVRFGGKELL